MSVRLGNLLLFVFIAASAVVGALALIVAFNQVFVALGHPDFNHDHALSLADARLALGPIFGEFGQVAFNTIANTSVGAFLGLHETESANILTNAISIVAYTWGLLCVILLFVPALILARG